MKIILASSSPRRRELLALAEIDFAVMRADIDESVHDQESSQDYIERMVAAKALAAMTELTRPQELNACLQDGLKHRLVAGDASSHSPVVLLLTADTIGVLPDGETILTKPASQAHAIAMWQQMSDRTHRVYSAVQATLVTFDQVAGEQVARQLWQRAITCCTEVTFISLSLEQMHRYWSSGEPHDKAGGYAIQGAAAAWVERINGSYTNVVGLPLAQTIALIQEAQDHAAKNNLMNTQ